MKFVLILSALLIGSACAENVPKQFPPAFLQSQLRPDAPIGYLPQQQQPIDRQQQQQVPLTTARPDIIEDEDLHNPQVLQQPEQDGAAGFIPLLPGFNGGQLFGRQPFDVEQPDQQQVPQGNTPPFAVGGPASGMFGNGGFASGLFQNIASGIGLNGPRRQQQQQQPVFGSPVGPFGERLQRPPQQQADDQFLRGATFVRDPVRVTYQQTPQQPPINFQQQQQLVKPTPVIAELPVQPPMQQPRQLPFQQQQMLPVYVPQQPEGRYPAFVEPDPQQIQQQQVNLGQQPVIQQPAVVQQQPFIVNEQPQPIAPAQPEVKPVMPATANGPVLWGPSQVQMPVQYYQPAPGTYPGVVNN